MKSILYLLGIFAALAVGAFGGYWFATKSAEGAASASAALELDYYSSYASIQMANGTDATREEVIRGHLALIEKYRGRPNLFFTEKSMALDSALAYARLSALAKKRGAGQESQQLLNRAVSFCPQLGWSECSSEKILMAVQQLDKQSVFGAGK